VKVRLALLKPKRRRRPPRDDKAPREIVPGDPFDAARARLKRKIPPRTD
jgi:hypothetical protein